MTLQDLEIRARRLELWFIHQFVVAPACSSNKTSLQFYLSKTIYEIYTNTSLVHRSVVLTKFLHKNPLTVDITIFDSSRRIRVKKECVFYSRWRTVLIVSITFWKVFDEKLVPWALATSRCAEG